MKITILAPGSRGDVQPYIALGSGLMNSGYDVTIVTHLIFKDLVKEYGLKYFSIPPLNPKEFLLNKAGRAFSSGDPLTSLIGGYYFFKSFCPIIEEMLDRCLEASCNSKLIISSIVSPGHEIAEKVNVPCIMAGLWPASPTSRYPHPVVTFNVGNSFNKLTHIIVEKLQKIVFGGIINNWRQRHSLKPLAKDVQVFDYIRNKGYPWIFGFSSSILPYPEDWKEHLKVTGYWFLDAPKNWHPPSDLIAFIESGPPPVYIGFGSMIHHKNEKISLNFINALDKIGCRGIISSGWSNLGISNLPENVFKIDSVPHSWLFPKMSAVIHHGGSGTTAAALRAGIPSLIIPFLADQFFWGKCIYRLGVGPKPLSVKKMNVRKLVFKINDMLANREMQKKAKELSKNIQNEDGVGEAVKIINNYLKNKNL